MQAGQGPLDPEQNAAACAGAYRRPGWLDRRRCHGFGSVAQEECSLQRAPVVCAALTCIQSLLPRSRMRRQVAGSHRSPASPYPPARTRPAAAPRSLRRCPGGGPQPGLIHIVRSGGSTLRRSPRLRAPRNVRGRGRCRGACKASRGGPGATIREGGGAAAPAGVPNGVIPPRQVQPAAGLASNFPPTPPHPTHGLRLHPGGQPRPSPRSASPRAAPWRALAGTPACSSQSWRSRRSGMTKW